MEENISTEEISTGAGSAGESCLKPHFFLLDESINDELRSELIRKFKPYKPFSNTVQEETGAKVYDEYAEDKILFAEDQVFKPVYDTVLPPPRNYRFVSLQKWEGVVTEIEDDSFTARLTDLTQGGSDEIIEFSFDDVPSDDRSLIQEDAIFYWNIGFETMRGQDRKVSLIKFRRLPRWSKKKIQAMREKGEDLMNQIQWE